MATGAHVTVVGRMGADWESRFNDRGDERSLVNVAVDDGFGDNKHTTWYRLTAFGKAAQTLAKYTHKGDTLTVVGKLSTSEYTGNDGKARFSCDVRVSDFILPDKPKDERDDRANRGSARGQDPYEDSAF